MTIQGRRYIQIYTGNGKGKTTAAIGQAIRAAGHGLKSCIIMFMKDFPYGELAVLKKLEQWITVEQFGDDRFVFQKRPPNDNEIGAAQSGLKRAREAMRSGEYDIVILDEVCVTTYFGLLTPEEVLPLLEEKPASVELVLTGRYCPDEWIAKADLVTRMDEVKHYYQKGVTTRKGFES
jgi:cob(I)alamin adenosyltransferase